MTGMPWAVADYLLRISATDRSPAFLEVSSDGLLLGWGGHIDAYGLAPLTVGLRVTEHVVMLEGLLPADDDGVVLPCVSLEQGRPADIHIIRTDGRDWVLLLDASPFEVRSRLPQQLANELVLAGGRGQGDGDLRAAVMGIALRTLDLVVLEREFAGSFTLIAGETRWWRVLFPHSRHGLRGLRPQESLRFLENFLVDAEACWYARREGEALHSGAWHERELMPEGLWLEAVALWSEGRAVLLIAGPGTALAGGELLQVGRSQGLELAGHRRAEAGLRRANEALETDLERRARELETANQRLSEELAQRRAAEATAREALERLHTAQRLEAVGRLAGGVAHDFNNLLTVISGYADLALGDVPVDSGTRREIEEIRHACDRGAALTRQLLAFGRKQPSEPVTMDLNDVVTGLATLLRRLIGEDIDLTIVVPPTPAPIRVDGAQIDQVLMNLAANARDAMPQGGSLVFEVCRVLLAEGERGLPGGAYIRLAVTDTGSGMDPATRERVFEPFFTTKADGRGTGIGLATVHDIVRQNRGAIAVESDLGGGTRFLVWLPEADDAAALTGAPDVQFTPRGTELVLLAEDEDSVRSLVRTLLEANGYGVLEARHGDEAMHLARQYCGRVDLLLADSIMPGMSGRQLADALRADQPSMQVLFMSGYPDEVRERHGSQEPAGAFLQKPFHPRELVTKVRDVLDRRGRHSAPPPRS